MKKTLLSVLFLLIILPSFAYDFAYTISGKTLYYNFSGSGTVELTSRNENGGYGNKLSGAIEIPSTVWYNSIQYTVTSIGDRAFYNEFLNNYITSITIPNTVTSIGNQAFYRCAGLTSISIPNSVTSIGNYAFYHCTGLNNVTFSTGIASIGDGAFAQCTGLTSISLPNSLGLIGNSIFSSCTFLQSVTLSDSLEIIPEYAFYNCNLNSIQLGDGIKKIADYAFSSNSNLHVLTIPDNVDSIGYEAFAHCTNIDTIYLGSNIKYIGERAFYECSNIHYIMYNIKNYNSGIVSPYGSISSQVQTVIFGDSVKSIPANAFRYKSSIVNLVIGSNVKTIGNSAFQNCVGIHNVVIPDSVSIIDQYAFSGCSGINTLAFGQGISSIGDYSFQNCTGLGVIDIPNGVISIGQSAFLGCTNVTSLQLGNNVVSVNNGAFQNCTSLNNVVIPNSVITIGASAFQGCSGVDSLSIGVGVVSIGNNAFQDCGNIQSVIIPNSVTTIGASAFQGCSSMDSLYIGAGVVSIGNNAFQNCSNIQVIIIPHNVTSLGESSFLGCLSANTLHIGAGIASIKNSTFKNCTSLLLIDIPSNVANIGISAFQGCISADSLHIGSGVDTIGSDAFSGCSGITHLTIPNNVSHIGNNAFEGCAGIGTLHIGNGVSTLNNSVFSGCTGIQNVSIPNTVTTIGQSVFNNCAALDSVYIGSGITSIGSGAFSGCNNIRAVLYNAKNCTTPLCYQSGPMTNTIASLTFGDSVQSVPGNAFYNCDNLQNISITAQTIGNNTFANCDNLLSANINVNNIGVNAFANCDRLVSVTLGDSVQTVGAGAFSGDFRLQTMNMGDNIQSLGDSVFQGCIRLTRPELPSSLQTIGTRAFDGCGDITGKLTFPAGVTSIGDYAFNGVGTISEIEMKGSIPPTIYAHTFASIDSLVTVSVPCGAVLNYYTTNYWENFPNIVEAPPFKLTVSSNNEVMGMVAITQQPTCSNYTARISATAETGYHFLRWNDGNTTNPRQINMTQDSSFEAIFVQNNSYITVEANNTLWGNVSGTGNYSYNAPVTLTATAYDGYHFLKWNDGNTQNPRYMAAICDTSFTAIFVSNVSTITVSNANPDWGNVSGSGVYYYQNLVSITATPVYGYHFAQWNDGNTQNPRTITVNQDSSFTAYFAVNTYSIVGTSNSTAMGSVTGGGTYTYLHEMSLTATPAFGYHFVQWNDQNTDNPRTITVTRDSAFTAQFAANSYTITAEPSDPTMGSAYGSGTYNFNTTATLTAVAEYGYHFTQWSDGVTDNPRSVTVQNSATYTAQFEINSYILTVQSSNPAIGTTSGGGSYNYLTPVNITANPNAGYHFTQWSDGNTDNPRLVTVTQNATYTAQFAINSYAVSVQSSNTNMGSVSGSGTYNHNSTATLTATAYYGYHFVQWQDGNTENPRSVVVTDSAQYTALFDYNSYLVTANSSNVTLGSATGGGSYNYLSQVALTAVAVPHYHFTMWNDSIEDNPRTITVTRDTLFTAHFAIDRHTIGVHTADAVMGIVSSSDTVDYNTAVWITATANYGYHFTQWNDGTTSNPRRVVVSQDTAFTASFAPNQYSATCAVNDNSRGSVASTGGNYNYLTSVTFTAIPNSDYHFLRWSNGSTENPITFTLTKDTVLTAILVGLTANVNDNTMGTVSHSKPSNLVEVVTATPNYGYHFVQWNDGITDNPRTMNLVGDTSVTAIFAVNNYYVALGVNDESLGSVVGEGEYPYLSTVTITANAAEHSHFLQWSDGNTTNPRMLTVTSDTSLAAYFEPDQQFQITVNANDTAMGSVNGSGLYFIGETVTITATANAHYYFAQWSDGNTSNPRVVTVTGDMTYTAVFEPVMYTLTVAANDYSMGQVTGGGSYAYGTEVTLEARAFGGYHFIGWDDGVMEEQRVVTVTEDAIYTALFEQNTGVDDVEAATYKVYAFNGRIVVEGVENKRVQIFDLTGRKHRNEEKLPTGVYLVRIDNIIIKKVVVL